MSRMVAGGSGTLPFLRIPRGFAAFSVAAAAAVDSMVDMADGSVYATAWCESELQSERVCQESSKPVRHGASPKFFFLPDFQVGGNSSGLFRLGGVRLPIQQSL